MEDIFEEEYMEEDENEGFLISDEYDSNETNNNIETEYLISIAELENVNDGESVTSISWEEEAEMFPEGARFMKYINEVIKMFPEEQTMKSWGARKVDQKERTTAQE